MGQPNSIPVQTQVVGQTGVVSVQTISTNRVVNRHSQHTRVSHDSSDTTNSRTVASTSQTY